MQRRQNRAEPVAQPACEKPKPETKEGGAAHPRNAAFAFNA
jgi:hypothetical protein